MKKQQTRVATGEIFILAGGLSSRMGRDKSGVKLGNATLLEHVRAAAAALGAPVRVVRRDVVPRCGPMGGIYTAFQRSRADIILFLACDMPFISPDFLNRMWRMVHKAYAARRVGAVFAKEDGRAGFPFVLVRDLSLKVVARQIAREEFSLQSLATVLGATFVRAPRGGRRQLLNLNTPTELATARQQQDMKKRKIN